MAPHCPHLAEEGIVEHAGDRALVARQPPVRFLLGLEQQELAVEGEEQAAMLLVEEQQRLALLALGEDACHALDTQLAGGIPQS